MNHLFPQHLHTPVLIIYIKDIFMINGGKNKIALPILFYFPLYLNKSSRENKQKKRTGNGSSRKFNQRYTFDFGWIDICEEYIGCNVFLFCILMFSIVL
jgi:hypothetical protein